MKPKFNNPRYCTKGISENVPIELQMILWSQIDSLEVEKDYLQVFTLTAEDEKQVIEHHQEFPEYRRKSGYSSDNPITAKIFVIDDETHSTMLLAEEY